MNDKTSDLRQRLFAAQEMTPSLQDAYQKELDSILHETLTLRKRLPSIVLLLILVACIIGIVGAMFVHSGAVFYTSAVTMLALCTIASAWIVRDQWRGSFVRKTSLKMADLFYSTAGVFTVLALFFGLRAASDPATTFHFFFPFVWLVTCLGWSLLNRIAAAELDVREQMLRIECRLADLAEKVGK
ncbi:MAG TPA: hypothetical protein VGM76_19310 [Lacipirellulaceae bacterium]|jgi:hypothetical protein